jgi:hypothetical protein
MLSKMKGLVVVMATFVCALSAAYADTDGKNVIYVGSGSSKSSNTAIKSSNPATLGYLRLSNTSGTVWGFDVSREGTMLDSTWGQRNSPQQATSFNFLIGKNLNKTEKSRIDAAFIAGIRETASSCPSSYLGYQCYADRTPDTSYGFNGGVALTWIYESFMVGARITSESKQALIGIRF